MACGSNPNSAPKFVVVETRWNVVGCYEAVGVSTDPNDPGARADENRCPASALIKNVGGPGRYHASGSSTLTDGVSGFCVTPLPWINPDETEWVTCDVSDFTNQGPTKAQNAPQAKLV